MSVNAYGERQRELAHAQRKLARMTKGSKSRNRLLRKVRSIHIQIAGRRLDHLQKIPHDLGKNHALIALEDLEVQEMTRSARGDEEQAREACTAEVIAEQGHP